MEATSRAVTDAGHRVAQATADSVRVAALRAAGAVAPRSAEEADAALEAARVLLAERRAALVAAEGERRLADLSLARGGAPTVVRAPADGIVLDVLLRDPQVATAGTPLLRLGDPASLELTVDVLSRDALRIAAGQSLVADFGDGVTYRGTVRLVEPAARVTRSPLGVEERRVRVHAALDEAGRAAAQRAGDAARAYLAITVAEDADALAAPATAFTRTVAGWQVYRVERGRLRTVTVRVGERGRDRWAIVDGLQPGDRVVRLPDATLRAGQRVRAALTPWPVDTGPPAAVGAGVP